MSSTDYNPSNVVELYPHIAADNIGIHADQKCWLGQTTCELCGIDIAEPYTGNNFLYDAKTLDGPWAVMCQECWQQAGHASHRLGTGLGQQYLLLKDGKFHKING